MTDTTREAFEAFMWASGNGRATVEMFERDASGDYVLPTIYATFYGWQAATERATQVERERCAALAENMTNQSRVVHGGMNAVQTPECKIAAAIRQGGAG